MGFRGVELGLKFALSGDRGFQHLPLDFNFLPAGFANSHAGLGRAGARFRFGDLFPAGAFANDGEPFLRGRKPRLRGNQRVARRIVFLL
ncbi:hypothetical protein D3C83_33050 [compost metagenome]